MPRRDDETCLRQMRDHAREASDLIVGRQRANLDRERVLSLALVQLLQIVGESANRVSETRRNQHPEIPWAQIVALRNRLIHGYDEIDFDILWQILTTDVPPLLQVLDRIFVKPPKP